MTEELILELEKVSTEEGGLRVIHLEDVRRLAAKHDLSPLDVEVSSLEAGIVPARYHRNMGTVGIEGQLKLLRACVGVCGLGGLGGHAVEFLARMGVGHLVLADGDRFVESNLNRQALCREIDLGRSKAERARERVLAVNSSLKVTAHQRFLSAEEVPEIFAEAQAVVDALDNVPSRLALQEGCAELGIPMVHGAIAGNAGQVMTVYPGDPGLKALYLAGEERGVEVVEGNPSALPALIAALQVQEVVKIICGGETIRHGFLFLDTSSNIFQFIPLREA